MVQSSGPAHRLGSWYQLPILKVAQEHSESVSVVAQGWGVAQSSDMGQEYRTSRMKEVP